MRDPLPLSSGEGVRIAAHVPGIEPDLAEHLGDPLLELGPSDDAVDEQGLAR